VGVSFDPSSDYPLGTRRPDLVTTPAGTPLDEVTLDALRTGAIGADELRATPKTLGLQAAVARAAGRPQLAENLERAAELAAVPAETILEIYTALRPGRSSAAELERWAELLEHEHGAPRTAAFVREARRIHAERGLLAAERKQAHERAETV
jgi:propanediol dehydratase small subunit